MPDQQSLDPNPALRAELEAASAALEPQIRGLTLLQSAIAPSHPLHAAVATKLADLERRRALIQGAIGSLDAAVTARTSLQADGYPDVVETRLDGATLAELEGDMADMAAAAGLFEGIPTLAVDLGQPADKTA